MKYYVVSDVHLHKFNEFSRNEGPFGNSRLLNQLSGLEDILKSARDDSEETTLLFLGDLYHQRGKVDTEVFNEGYKLFSKYPDIPVYMLEGNHDNVNNSINSPSSLELFSLLPNVTLIPTYEKVKVEGTEDTFVGISYGEEFSELKTFIKENKATFILGHLGIEGAIGAGSTRLDGPFTTQDLLVGKNYQLGLLGHYHGRQELVKNLWYVGNPVAQNFSDEGQEKGYMTFTTDSKGTYIEGSLEFHNLGYPMFIKITDENLSDYVDRLDSVTKNNYVRLVVNDLSANTLKLSEDHLENEENIRVEKQIKVESKTRINITSDDSLEEVAKSWSDEFQPDNKETIIKQLRKVIQ